MTSRRPDIRSLEFSNQGGIVVDGVHQHTIFRDQTADYGWN